MAILFPVLLACLGLSSATSVPYSEYILAPKSRTVIAPRVHKVNGTVSNAASLTKANGGAATFNGVSSVTFDYGINIAGVVSVTVGKSSNQNASIGLTYTESSLWISGQASDGTADAGLDEVLWLPVGKSPGTYTVDRAHERGGFRYLSLVSKTNATIEVMKLVTNYTAAPVQDLRAYRGYFHSNDELLNRIWCIYKSTVQHQSNLRECVHLGTINSTQNISLPQTDTWYNNATICKGSSCVVDGAKRDREVWPGDMSVALPSIFVSTNDMDSVKNSLNSLLALQNKTGQLPYAGYPFDQLGIYSGDHDYLESVWHHFTSGIAWSLGYIDDSGLMNVTSNADWLRVGMGGHIIEANAILYYTLNEGINLAKVLDETSYISNWTAIAATLKTSANALLYNATTGLYHDNETTVLSPQDGNAWAIKANLTQSLSQSLAVSKALKSRWGKYGAPAPEAGSLLTISPFIGSFELEAHLLAGDEISALQLIRTQWGFMLDDPRMTNSTFMEGYSADGSLHYAPYTNDPRVSHAHGWSTGPTSLMSFYVAGIHLESASGLTWRIAPQPGDLTSVDAGFVTKLGGFKSNLTACNGTVNGLSFETPEGTSGSVNLPGLEGSLVCEGGGRVELVGGVAKGLKGGKWKLAVKK